jgi:hypothetical protein
MRVWRGGMGKEEWRKGEGMTWIFKPKRQTVADKKSERNSVGIGIERAGTGLSLSLS